MYTTTPLILSKCNRNGTTTNNPKVVRSWTKFVYSKIAFVVSINLRVRAWYFAHLSIRASWAISVLRSKSRKSPILDTWWQQTESFAMQWKVMSTKKPSNAMQLKRYKWKSINAIKIFNLVKSYRSWYMLQLP